jgi:hypothetical protein
MRQTFHHASELRMPEEARTQTTRAHDPEAPTVISYAISLEEISREMAAAECLRLVEDTWAEDRMAAFSREAIVCGGVLGFCIGAILTLIFLGY